MKKIIIIFIVLVLMISLNQNQISINGNTINIELATTPLERTKGLMFRENLQGGMLFIFEEEDTHSFWMKNTLIPLDIIWLNKNKEVVSIEEKPVNPKSNYAVVGLYYYPNDVIEIAKNVKPSNRGELEITTVNNIYLNEKKLKVELMGRGFAWLDTGTIDAINNASNFIRTIEERQGLKVACLEEIAYQNNFINKYQLNDIIKNLSNDYANYLSRLIDN